MSIRRNNAWSKSVKPRWDWNWRNSGNYEQTPTEEAAEESLDSYWTQRTINDSCVFFASDNVDILNKVTSTQLPNQVTGSSDYLTVTGTGLDARYRTPDTDTYRTADSDHAFWKTDASESSCDGNRLIGYDFSRVLVKYLDVAPYTIQWIAILKVGAVITNQMRDAFHLSIWWDDTYSFYGVLKQNRLSEKSTWPVPPAKPSGLALALIAGQGGVKIDWTDNTSGTAQTEIWGRINSAASALLYTINAGTVTKNDARISEIQMTYKIRSKSIEGIYSDFTAEVSIAMLSTEYITNMVFDNATGWTLGAGWTIADGLLKGAVNYDYAAASINNGCYAGFTWNLEFDITSFTAGVLNVSLGGTQNFSDASWQSNGHKRKIMSQTNGTARLYFNGNSAFYGHIDNVSCRYVLNA